MRTLPCAGGPLGRAVTAIAISSLVSACAIAPDPATPTPTAVPATPTSTPTPTPTSSPSPSPSPTAKVCTPIQVLADVQGNMPYGQAVITFGGSVEERTLIVWYVESAIDPEAQGAAIDETLTRIVPIGSQMAIRLKAWGWPCLSDLFQYVYLIAVDREYNLWFSGVTSLDDLPLTAVPNKDQAERVKYAFDYIRQGPTKDQETPPMGSCSWQEANEKLHMHFSAERIVVGFYLVSDDAGANVWARWDGPPEGVDLIGAFLPSLLNVVMEVRCLHPRADHLWATVVSDQGEVLLFGELPGDAIQREDYPATAIEQFKVLGPPELLEKLSTGSN